MFTYLARVRYRSGPFHPVPIRWRCLGWGTFVLHRESKGGEPTTTVSYVLRLDRGRVVFVCHKTKKVQPFRLGDRSESSFLNYSVTLHVDYLLIEGKWRGRGRQSPWIVSRGEFIRVDSKISLVSLDYLSVKLFVSLTFRYLVFRTRFRVYSWALNGIWIYI